jgi:hypothetical protein
MRSSASCNRHFGSASVSAAAPFRAWSRGHLQNQLNVLIDRPGAQTHAVLVSILRTIQQRQLDTGAVFSQLLRSRKPITALASPNGFPVESRANGQSHPG